MSLSPGTPLGPYRIVAPLGAGGMGEVYRARDTRLGRDVAIKVLRAEVAGDPERVKRFEKEARTVASLSHPNILALFDVGSHEGQPYLVTELLEGQTLAERIRAGDLTVAKAVELGTQIAHGLAAAHEHGIVHRDLKPGNVFVTRDGVVKVLDFGLARLTHIEAGAWDPATASTETGLTGARAVLGTVGYMAPEQVRGLPADHRSDIFAFGCVLHEMLGGERAFRGDTPTDVTAAILKDDPTPLPSSVPPGLDKIVRRCLEKRPEERFSSAHDVALVLEATSPAAPVSVVRRRAWWLQRRLVIGSASVLVLVAALTGMWLWRQRQAGPALEPRRVVIASFENRTGDRSLDALGALIPEALAQGASGIGNFTVVPSPAALGRDVVDSETAMGQRGLRRLAQETGAGVVVSGAYYLLGGELRVQSQLIEAASGRVIHVAEAVTGPRTAQAEVVEKLRQRVLGAVASHYDSALSQGLVHWPLLDAYLELRRGREARGSDVDMATRHLERSLDLDPDFFLPAHFLYDVYLQMQQCDDAWRVLRRFDDRLGRLTPYERLLYGEACVDMEGRYNEYLRFMRERAVLTPDDLRLRYAIGFGDLFMRRPGDAVAMLEKVPFDWVGPTDPYRSWATYMLALAHHRLRQYEKELEAARLGRQHFPDALELYSREVGALAALGRLAETDRVVEDAATTLGQHGSPGQMLVLSAVELRAHGYREAGQRLAERAVTWFAERPFAEQAEHAPTRVLALVLAERWREASQAAEALPEDPKRRSWDILTIFWGQPAFYRLGWMGAIAARLGDAAQARRLSAELRHFRSSCPAYMNAYWPAAIGAQLGPKEEAMRLFEEAVAKESAMVWQADHDVLLEPLWNEPHFAALVRPYEAKR